MKTEKRPTIADLRAAKGKRQLSMLQVDTLDEAAAAEAAGIDMLSVPLTLLGAAFREAAPTIFAIPCLEHRDYVNESEYLRAAFGALNSGGDAVYCAASLGIVRRLRDEGVPVCGHTGLIPSHCTWTGGYRAVGKTAESAMEVWEQVKALEGAGAFSAEIEVVPAEVAALISEQTSLILISMGAGAGCDVQYLYASDVLGSTRGHVPRHSKAYRNFAAEHDRLQHERVAAFKEYARDVASGGFPEPQHIVGMAEDEIAHFRDLLAQSHVATRV